MSDNMITHRVYNLVFIVLIFFVFGCAQAPRKDHEIQVLKKQILELQKNQGEQTKLITDLNNRIMILNSKNETFQKNQSIYKPSEIIGAQKIYDQALKSYHTADTSVLEKDVELLVKGFKQSPLTNNALFLLGQSYFKKGDYENATKQFEKIFKLFPQGDKAATSLYYLGLCYKKQGRHEAAHDAFRNVLLIYPESQEAKHSAKLIESHRKKL